MTWILTPAYGREYKTPNAAIADFESGKDFVVHATPSGPIRPTYCSKRDIPSNDRVNIRYNRKSDVAVLRNQ
jgi:hypothetical protein